MQEELDGEGAPSEALQNARNAASDAYGQLVRATADICSPRYHYFCDDEMAKLPLELVVVANTRRVPIRDNALLRLGSPTGALEAEAVKGKGPGDVQFVPVKGPDKAREMKRWKASVRDDLACIQQACPGANYVCMPEFGFPFGLQQTKAVEPPESEADWKWLQGSEILTSRFVCLGSAHRRYQRSPDASTLRYENVAVVYPNGLKHAVPAADTFIRKRDKVTKVARVDGVELRPTVDHSLSAHFTETDVTVTRRAQLSSPECASIDATRIRHAKEAFDFYDMTADGGKPPLYIRKKSPARKLGEYIDAGGRFELDVFITELGVLAVLICYDAFDPAIFLSAVRMYYESAERGGGYIHQAIDVFFIPAFNRSAKFVDMCQVLSRETNSVVVYVSGDERCPVKSDVFVCGQRCETWAASMTKGEPHDAYYSIERIVDHEHLHIHRIRKEVIDAAMRHMRIHAPPGVRRNEILTPKRLGARALG